MTIAEQVAHALLEIGALRFQPQKPLMFKSGIISPVYVDNRQLIFHPSQWRMVIEGFAAMLTEQSWQYDVIGGVATAGIPHSSALAFHIQKPSIFVRKASKAYGTQQLVEGGDVTDKLVLLVEDMVTTGGSSLMAVKALRDAGARVEKCLCITTYGFADSTFAEYDVELHALADFSTLVDVAVERGDLSAEQRPTIYDWLHDATGWASRHGFA